MCLSTAVLHAKLLTTNDIVTKAYFLQRITRGTIGNFSPSILKTFEAESMFLGRVREGGIIIAINTIIHQHSFPFTGILFTIVWLLLKVVATVMLGTLSNELGVISLFEDVPAIGIGQRDMGQDLMI